MAYGDGGFYFLQPVSQPAGAYGGIGSYGELTDLAGSPSGHQLKYQSKVPTLLASAEQEVNQLLTIYTKLDTEIKYLQAGIKRLRRLSPSVSSFPSNVPRYGFLPDLSKSIGAGVADPKDLLKGVGGATGLTHKQLKNDAVMADLQIRSQAVALSDAQTAAKIANSTLNVAVESNNSLLRIAQLSSAALVAQAKWLEAKQALDAKYAAMNITE